MQALALLLGYALAAITMALGYNVMPALFVLVTAVTIVMLRAWDRRQRGA